MIDNDNSSEIIEHLENALEHIDNVATRQNELSHQLQEQIARAKQFEQHLAEESARNTKRDNIFLYSLLAVIMILIGLAIAGIL